MAQLIAIAASQAGPAHSFITGEALRAAAERLGHRLALWVQSPLGDQGGWSETELAQAQACILASDLDLDSPAATHAPVLRIDPTEVLADAEGAVRRALQLAGALPPGPPCGTGRRPGGRRAQRAAAHRGHHLLPHRRGPHLHGRRGAGTGRQGPGPPHPGGDPGLGGAQNALSPQAIAEADLVIIAADTQVQRERFAGKRLYVTSTKAAIHDAGAVFAQAAREATPWSGAGRRPPPRPARPQPRPPPAAAPTST
jgi:PTS system fructose-specific IIC component